MSALLCALVLPSAASAAPGCESSSVVVSRPGRWTAPLSHPITIHARDITLRDALERVAAAAHVRLSYSADLLPLDRKVCVLYESVPIGDVIANLLRGVAVQPVIAGVDHVVLSPGRSALAPDADDATPQPLYPLKAVVATAQAAQARTEAAGFAAAQVDRTQLARHSSVSEALNSSMPGVWVWHSPAGFVAQYSVRGASSFGASTPKIYIDGIEVANPHLITQIQPDNVERIEFIRGPQGGALYGDAINGVTNIVMRHASGDDGIPRLRVRSGLAVSSSDFMANTGVGQEHMVALQLGSRARSGAINVGLGSLGEYMPGTFARHLTFDGNVRLVGARTLVTGTARFYSQSAGDPSMRQYTVGGRATLTPSEKVTHTLVFGVDGYGLSGISHDSTTRLSLTDSVLRAAGDGALRTTLRLATVARFGAGAHAAVTLTGAAEHSALRQFGVMPYSFDEARTTNGLSAQLDAALFERLFVTGGLRVQNDDVNGAFSGTTTLPMLGGAYVIATSDLSVKLRGAYGKAIRWPDMSGRESFVPNLRAPFERPVLTPEQQSGLEAGLELSVRGTLGLQVTRYQQTASGLMQRIALQPDTMRKRHGPGIPAYHVQSVGEIANRGWEMQAYARHGGLSLNAAFALVDSRVLRLADGYAGDLQPGGRMLAVPAKTASVGASYNSTAWSTSLMAYRAFDWINYDRAALAGLAEIPAGPALRDFWRSYGGSTRLRASFTRELRSQLSLLISGDNLLGTQTGEPDNLTIIPGRTVSLGVRAAF